MIASTPWGETLRSSLEGLVINPHSISRQEATYSLYLKRSQVAVGDKQATNWKHRCSTLSEDGTT